MKWNALPQKLKALIVLFTIFAIPIVCWSGWDIAHQARSIAWIVLSVLNLLTVPFFVVLPSASMVVHVGDAYMMALAMIYGTSPCIVTTVCQTLVGRPSMRYRPKLHEFVFNISSMVCVAFVYSNVYQLTKPTEADGINDIILPAVALAVTFFLSNSLLAATAVSWTSDKNVLKFWARVCLPLAAHFGVSATGAIFLVLYKENPWAPLAVAPVIGVVWGWTKATKARLTRQSAT